MTLVNTLDFPSQLDEDYLDYPTLAAPDYFPTADVIETAARINDLLWDGAY